MQGPPDARARRSERSGWLRVLLALLAAVALVFLLGAVALFFYLRSPEGQRRWAAVKRSIDWAVEAQQAPGADALRGAGCSVALVSTVAGLEGALSGLVPPEQIHAIARGEPESPLVLCIARTRSMRGPICPALARAYGGADPEAPPTFLLAVYDEGSGELSCQGVYAPDGTLQRAVDEDEEEDSPRSQSPLPTADTLS